MDIKETIKQLTEAITLNEAEIERLKTETAKLKKAKKELEK